MTAQEVEEPKRVKIKISNRLLMLFMIWIVLAGYTFFVYSTPSDLTPKTLPKFSKAKVVSVKITDAKMATGLDEQLMPIQVTDVFPRDTRQVFCWLSWSDATPKMEMKVVWNYEIDDIKVLTYDFRVPRKKGSGGISLTLPTGKVLPVGSYRVDIIAQNKILKSLAFKVK